MYDLYYVLHGKDKTVRGSDILSVKISEKEGYKPELVVVIFCDNLPKNITTCEIFANCKTLFSGHIKLWKKTGNTLTLTVISNAADDNVQEISEIDELLFGENKTQSLQETLAIPYYSSCKETEIVSLLDEKYIDISDIEDTIISGSLKSEKYNSEVGDLDVSVTASWLSREYGDFDISNMITSQFSGGKINTLTPLKLENAWPKQWARIGGIRHHSGNKYFVSFSRLKPSDTLHTDPSYLQPVNFSIDDKKFSINRHIYDCKLVISYGYDQYRKETIAFNVKNRMAWETKQIKINLGNISDFIKDSSCTSFFSTKFGNDVYKKIVELSKNYVWLTNRNMKFSWKMAYNPAINCKTKVKIGNHIAKITSIESNNLRTMSVTALSFSDNMDKPANYQISDIAKPKQQTVSINDLVDIYVKNDGKEQIEKLQNFIANTELTTENYEQIITNFLNTNQTTITIVTKPIKQHFCEHSKIKIDQQHFI